MKKDEEARVAAANALRAYRVDEFAKVTPYGSVTFSADGRHAFVEAVVTVELSDGEEKKILDAELVSP